jgi:hypothetical protein
LGSALPAPLPVSSGALVNVTPSTFQAAMNAAQPGQQLVLAAGTYGDSSTRWQMSNSGTSSAPITITGSGVTIKGQLRVTGSYIRLDGLHHVGPAPDASSTLIWINGGSHVEVRNCEVTGSYSRSAIYVDGGASAFRIERCYLHDNGRFDIANAPEGGLTYNLDQTIYVSSASSGLIANNLMLRSRAFMIQLYPGPVSNVIVTGNTIDHSGSDGLILSGNRVAGNRITGNIISSPNVYENNGSVEIYQKVGSGNVVTNNVMTAGPDGSARGVTFQNNVVTSSVGYVGGSDYHLVSGSPAIGLAEPAYSLSPDYAGVLRDSAPDASAYEH